MINNREVNSYTEDTPEWVSLRNELARDIFRIISNSGSEAQAIERAGREALRVYKKYNRIG